MRDSPTIPPAYPFFAQPRPLHTGTPRGRGPATQRVSLFKKFSSSPQRETAGSKSPFDTHVVRTKSCSYFDRQTFLAAQRPVLNRALDPHLQPRCREREEQASVQVNVHLVAESLQSARPPSETQPSTRRLMFAGAPIPDGDVELHLVGQPRSHLRNVASLSVLEVPGV